MAIFKNAEIMEGPDRFGLFGSMAYNEPVKMVFKLSNSLVTVFIQIKAIKIHTPDGESWNFEGTVRGQGVQIQGYYNSMHRSGTVMVPENWYYIEASSNRVSKVTG